MAPINTLVFQNDFDDEMSEITKPVVIRNTFWDDDSDNDTEIARAEIARAYRREKKNKPKKKAANMKRERLWFKKSEKDLERARKKKESKCRKCRECERAVGKYNRKHDEYIRKIDKAFSRK